WECCPTDWLLFNRQCYYFSNDTSDWFSSQENCTSMGSHLVVINNIEEQDLLVQHINETKQPWWIGLSDHIQEGQWRWVDGTPYDAMVIKRSWENGQPDNYSKEDCVAMGRWKDKSKLNDYPW
uniref:C-type lectin domain-containing protein n=1 Tax=Latimeria chalumnae TaxID=7897 RepID=H3AQ96_LATCH